MAHLGLRQIIAMVTVVTLFSACGGKLSSSKTPYGPPGGGFTSKPTAPAARGSQAVLCLDDQGKLKSIELLDYVQGRQSFGLTPIASTSDVVSQTSHLLDVIANGIGDPGEGTPSIRMKLQTAANPFLDSSSKIRQHDSLAVTEAAGLVKLEKGCSVQQLARTVTSNGNSETVLNADLFDQLNPTSQAGAIAHEALASYLEKFGEPSSNRVRAFIAQLGSGQTFAAVASRLSSPFVECTNQSPDPSVPSSHLYLSQNGDNVSIFAQAIAGVPRLGDEPLSRSGKLSDFTSDAVCQIDRILKIPVSYTNLIAGNPYAADMLFQVCNLGQISVYAANQNGNLAALVRNGIAQKLKCVSKTTLAQ